MARIARTLRDADVPYMVIGGQAVLRHGEFRVTDDIDLTLGLSPFDAERVLALLPDMGLTPAIDRPQEFVKASHLLPCDADYHGVRVDISFAASPYLMQAIGRTVIEQIEGVPVRFASVEDLLVHKLIASRARDIDDARSVILKNPGFDRDEVRHWLVEFEQVLEKPLVEPFEQLLRECDG